jgi:hypothetical protein
MQEENDDSNDIPAVRDDFLGMPHGYWTCSTFFLYMMLQPGVS